MAYNTWEEMEQEFGSELTDVVRGQQQHSENLAKQTRRQNMMNLLDMTIPDWRVINDSDDFLKWLSQKYPGSTNGYTLHNALHANWEAGNASEVAKFFNGYKQGLFRGGSHGTAPQEATQETGSDGRGAPGRNAGAGALRHHAQHREQKDTQSAARDVGMAAARFGYASPQHREVHRLVFGFDIPVKEQLGIPNNKSWG